MAMQPYVVRQGDYLTKLAHQLGFDADEVWKDAKNSELKDLRKSPDILAPGDVLFIPTEPPPSLALTSGTTNDYNATIPRVTVTLVFLDGTEPLKGEPCSIEGLDANDPDVPTSTNDEGKLVLQIPVTIREIAVRFPDRTLGYRFCVGDLNPAIEPSGIRQRLCNLGYLLTHDVAEGGSTAEEDEVLKMAVSYFQSANGLAATGEIDDATRKAIVDAHQM